MANLELSSESRKRGTTPIVTGCLLCADEIIILSLSLSPLNGILEQTQLSYGTKADFVEQHHLE